MKTNYIPAFVMLIAGFIDCIISIYFKLDLLTFTKRLLLVLVIFYILGSIVKVIIDKSVNVMKEDTPEEISSKDLDDDEGEEESENEENVEE